MNRHDRNDRGILSPLCLPISPPGQGDEIEGGEAYHANAESQAPYGRSWWMKSHTMTADFCTIAGITHHFLRTRAWRHNAVSSDHG